YLVAADHHPALIANDDPITRLLDHPFAALDAFDATLLDVVQTPRPSPLWALAPISATKARPIVRVAPWSAVARRTDTATTWTAIPPPGLSRRLAFRSPWRRPAPNVRSRGRLHTCGRRYLALLGLALRSA